MDHVPETAQAKRARLKQERAALEAEALQVKLAEANAQLPWRILELISKAQLAGKDFKLRPQLPPGNWKLWFETTLVEFSEKTLTFEKELNRLEGQLVHVKYKLDKILEDQETTKKRDTRKVELLASLTPEDKEILGLTKPKDSRYSQV
jgi:hypothetical protein